MAQLDLNTLRFTMPSLRKPDQVVSQPKKEPSKVFRRVGLPLIAGSNGLDLGSSLWLSQKDDPRIKEMNPLYQNDAVMTGIKSGTTALEAWLLDKYAKDHPKLAMLAAGAVSGLPLWAGMHNIKLGRSLK